MNRGIAVVSHDLLGNQNRVFEVVAVPGHERDQHVLPQCQFAQVGRCAIGDDIAARNLVTHLDDGTLVDIGILVRARVFNQVINIHADFTRRGFIIIDLDDNPVGIDIIDNTTTGSSHHRTRVNGASALDPGADHRFFRTQARHGLALHVGTHQGAVGIVMLQEWNQRSRDRDNLRGRHVHVLHFVRRDQHEFAGFTARHQLIHQLACRIHGRIGLGNDIFAFFNRRQIVNLVGHFAVDHATIRCFEKAIFVQACIQGQRVDQTNVRAFRCFNRADTTIVRGVHVAHLKAGTFTR